MGRIKVLYEIILPIHIYRQVEEVLYSQTYLIWTRRFQFHSLYYEQNKIDKPLPFNNLYYNKNHPN